MPLLEPPSQGWMGGVPAKMVETLHGWLTRATSMGHMVYHVVFVWFSCVHAEGVMFALRLSPQLLGALLRLCRLGITVECAKGNSFVTPRQRKPFHPHALKGRRHYELAGNESGANLAMALA